jgi:hypothetical protein
MADARQMNGRNISVITATNSHASGFGFRLDFVSYARTHARTHISIFCARSVCWTLQNGYERNFQLVNIQYLKGDKLVTFLHF